MLPIPEITELPEPASGLSETMYVHVALGRFHPASARCAPSASMSTELNVSTAAATARFPLEQAADAFAASAAGHEVKVVLTR